MAYIVNKPGKQPSPAPRTSKLVVSDLDYVSVSPLNLEELRRMRILIVDDTPDNIDLVKAMLEKSGFTNTLSAASGSDALASLRAALKDGVCDVDIVLLDVMMPKMDGYEVCRIIRAHG